MHPILTYTFPPALPPLPGLYRLAMTKPRNKLEARLQDLRPWTGMGLGRDLSPARTNMSRNPQILRNLSRRLPKPALGNGRVQTQSKRCFCAFGDVISTSDAISWAFPRADRRTNNFNRSVRRALMSIGAVRVGRAKTMGRPWLWRLPL
jgi:hypothetical protein